LLETYDMSIPARKNCKLLGITTQQLYEILIYDSKQATLTIGNLLNIIFNKLKTCSAVTHSAQSDENKVYGSAVRIY